MSLSTSRTEKARGLAHSLNLPENFLKDTQQRTNTRPTTNGGIMRLIQPYQTISFVDQRPKTTQRPTRKVVIKGNTDEKEQSLSRRLKSLREENKNLQSFSLSKLLSKVRVVSVDAADQTKAGMSNTAPVPIRVQLRRFVRPRMFQFHNKSAGPNDQPLSTSLNTHTITTITKQERYRKQQEEQSSNIFRRYFCPAFTYRDPQFLRSIEPDKSFLINQWEHRIETKRIHNFYTSHMYKHGYQRHFTTSKRQEIMRPQSVRPVSESQKRVGK